MLSPESQVSRNTAEKSSSASVIAGDSKTVVAPSTIVKRVKQMSPWRMNIQITEKINTGDFVSSDDLQSEKSVQGNPGARERFLNLVDLLFPNGLSSKRFLDCGCNAGGYCFWARERDADIGYGFDAREHWIKQARFIKRQRTVGPVNRLQFEVMNLYDLPKRDLNPFEIVQFNQLFHILPDPVGGLKYAADLCREMLFFSTPVLIGETDGSLKSTSSDQELDGNIDKLCWLPTGPGVCAEIVRYLGFDEIKLLELGQSNDKHDLGNLTIIAARETRRLLNLPGKLL